MQKVSKRPNGNRVTFFQLARKYDMVIISSILERDASDVLWNTAGDF
jgi:hypothetical protein